MPRVLVVDDDADFRELLKVLLDQLGYSVEEACDSHSVLEMPSLDHYDAIVTDVMMPKIDGITLIKMIRAAECNIPIIAISGSKSTLPNQIGLSLSKLFGASEVLYKPFSRDELALKLKNCIAESRIVALLIGV
ncbi:MAG: response regulator [Rhodospirillaceae bacterium]|nr:response regulator [Rhodospirillaceae bacterium]